jgi:hypothetical protein
MKGLFPYKNTGYLLITVFLFSCGGDSGGGDDVNSTPDPDPIVAPSATTLVFPDDDSECTEGEIISDTQSRVLFQWNASQNTDSYQVNLKNLNTNSVALTNSNTNEAEITLLRGVPYEWFVVSRANGTTQTASSPVWRFYNAGPGISSFAPFPAEAIAPTRGATIPATASVALQWFATDIDEDISTYNLYFGTENPPELLEEGLTDTSFEVVVASGLTYFWQIETVDSAGNRSLSELFNFQVE